MRTTHVKAIEVEQMEYRGSSMGKLRAVVAELQSFISLLCLVRVSAS
jgi:hypothetical protein